jgi:AcrR family transcriptional regulator
MMSQHRTLREAVDDTDEVTRAPNAIPKEQILDAAYELLLAVGMRRLNMADIARSANVSRATLYRHWPNASSVVGALVTREFAGVTAHAFATDTQSARVGLVNGVVATVRSIRVHPLMRKIIDVDPQFLLPYLVERRGTSTTQQLGLMEMAVQAGRVDGSIRGGVAAPVVHAALQARAIWLLACSFTLTAPVLADEVSLEDLDGQLVELLDRYLAP